MRSEIVAVLFATCLVSDAAAQETSAVPVAPLSAAPVSVGDRVRVTRWGTRQQDVYIVKRVENDALIVGALRGGRTDSIPIGSIQTLERSVGRYSFVQRTMRATGTGFLVGGGMGAITGYALAGDCRTGTTCTSRSEAARIGAAVLAVVGGGAGLVVGAISPSDKWRAVDWGSRVSVAPGSDSGIRVSISTTF